MNSNLPPRGSGISVRSLLVPAAVTVAVLHVLIIIVILFSDIANTVHSTALQDEGRYTQEASSYMGNVSRLCETASSFVITPVTGDGELNVGPLFTYAEGLDALLRKDQLLERFRSYDVSPEALSYFEDAVYGTEYLLDATLHAISLIDAVYPLPNVPALNSIPRTELTSEEQAMSDGEKTSVARRLLGSEFGQQKWAVNQSVSACTAIIQESTARFSDMISRRIAYLRIILWVTTSITLGILVVTFFFLYTQMMQPLQRTAQLILSGEPLDERKGFREVRMASTAYNDVRKRRDTLDAILRSAAETDALTNLPNRYRFEQFLLESEENGYAAAVLLFDVNYLKQTNDTMGHLAGDALIRSAAECIRSCFGEDCFRFGGDEFAAVVKGCAPEDIRRMADRFEREQQERGISISYGYALSPEIGETSFKTLLNEADKRMYARKKEMHRNARALGQDGEAAGKGAAS